eukprot:8733846-Pyramimonas_sp.AAC.1
MEVVATRINCGYCGRSAAGGRPRVSGEVGDAGDEGAEAVAEVDPGEAVELESPEDEQELEAYLLDGNEEGISRPLLGGRPRSRS